MESRPLLGKIRGAAALKHFGRWVRSLLQHIGKVRDLARKRREKLQVHICVLAANRSPGGMASVVAAPADDRLYGREVSFEILEEVLRQVGFVLIEVAQEASHFRQDVAFPHRSLESRRLGWVGKYDVEQVHEHLLGRNAEHDSGGQMAAGIKRRDSFLEIHLSDRV